MTTVDLSHPDRDALVALRPIMQRTVLPWWLTIAAGFGTAAVIRGVLADAVGSSTWQYVATAPKIIHLVIEVLLPSVLLPMFVAQGITRAGFARAAGTTVAAIALLGAVIITIGYLIEAAVADANGWGVALDGPHLYATTTASHLVLLEHSLLLLAWTVSGWLIAVGYIALGWWRGTLMTVPGSVPLVAAELALATDWTGDLLVGWLGISRPPLVVAVVMAGVSILLGALAARRLTTRLQLRTTPGWTTL